MPRTLATSLLALALAAGLAAQTPEPTYSMAASRQEAGELLKAYFRKAGRRLILPDLPNTMVTVNFEHLPFEAGLRMITDAARWDFRATPTGYAVDTALELKIRFPEPNEKDLDAVYRCRRISALSLSQELARHFGPEVRFSTGPNFLTPALMDSASSGYSAGDGPSVRAMGATEDRFKTHDVVISGPAAEVRRALRLCVKLDRARKQVRINIRVMEVSKNAEQELGLNWLPSGSASFSTSEVPSAGTTTPNPSVNGLSLGRFSHSPMSLTARLNAAESKGSVKTLSNPTLMLLDGERSFILSGAKHTYPKFMGRDSNGQSEYDTVEAKVGIYLQVGVQVGLDDDMVLTLYPQVTAVSDWLTLNGGRYPVITTNEEQTTVRASHQEVIVIGGLKQNIDGKERNGLPFLSRIPILGGLFSTLSKNNSQKEVLIVLTPELVPEPMPPVQAVITETPGI